MNYFDKIKRILIKPIDFFGGDLKREKGVGKALKFYAIFMFFNLTLALLIALLFKFVTDAFGLTIYEESTLFYVLIMPAIYFVLIGFVFIWTGIIHLWVKLFGGREDYTKTFQTLIYSSTPSVLFGWIPLIGDLTGIYSFVLLVIGVSEVHKMSKLKSFLIFFIPMMIFIMFVTILVILAFLFIPAFAQAALNV